VWDEGGDSGRRAVSFSPSLEGLDFDGYLSPAPILPVSASRGCYWARCAFCPEAAGDRQPYAAANADELSEIILRAKKERGVRFVHFTDNALSPLHLQKFAENLKGSGIKWYGFARLERQLEEPLFMKNLAEGGCAMLQLGIESASKRLLDLMRKGIDPDRASVIVENARSAGIRVFGYFLFGMPTETPEEARRTIGWIKSHPEALTFLNLSLMNFPRGGEMEAAPDQFGLESVRGRDEKNDLSLYLEYAGKETMERRELRRILTEAKRDPVIKKMLLRSPPWLTSNHGAFAPLP
ncbi:radical SAM protein, partial [bacterium]